jgi:hypothetical protein
MYWKKRVNPEEVLWDTLRGNSSLRKQGSKGIGLCVRRTFLYTTLERLLQSSEGEGIWFLRFERG